ncbi:60Kd inner membrane protein-domain-containing protein [Cladorrhinum sp. PSN259]|nr:60Kd inner membrane protein-domain-containing protein [Cladorrhinum sp. PSN259]
MASEEPPNPMAESGVTIRSDSEQYSAGEDISMSPPSTSSPAVILYQPPSVWSIFRGAVINLVLPFINGMMLGFGELFAHEAAFRLGWSNTRRPPPIGPSIGTRQGSKQARYASTQPSPPPLDGAAAVGADASNLTDIAATPVTLSGSDLLDLPEQAGFLKALGLDYGWGTTSLLQSCFESVYIHTGLPWWASIALVAVGARVLLFKPTLDAAENSQKMQDLMKDPVYLAAQQTVKDSFGSKNPYPAMEARAKMSAMNKAKGYSIWKQIFPLIQIPIGYGMFRILRDMAAIPVPSMETGGFGWITDLTVSDPFFVLPIASGILFIQALRIPLPYMAPAQQKTMKAMALVVGPITGIVSLFFPAGLQFFVLVTSVLHYGQQLLMHQGWFRRMVGLSPLGQSAGGSISYQAPRVIDTTAARVAEKTSAPVQKESIYASIKSTAELAKEKMETRTQKSSAERAQAKAQEYEQKRALEEKERLVARQELRKLKSRRD